MPIRRRTLSTLGIAFLLIVLACSKSSETTTVSPTTTTAQEAASPPPVHGPVLIAVMASSIDDKGRPVNPRSSFAPDDRQIALFALAGKTNGAPMDIVWYKTSPEGDQKLFEHHVPVKTLDRAYSIGRNPGTLAAGNYKATVTLDGQTREVPFDVKPEKTSQRAAAGNAPIPGASGTVPEPPREAGSANCHLADHLYDSPPIVLLAGAQVCGDKNFPLLVTAATPGGKPSRVPAGGEVIYPVNPCLLDKPDDFPGTKITFTVEGTRERSQRETKVLSLPPDTLTPQVRWLPPTPADGSKVEAGKPIVLSVIADDADNGRGWPSSIVTLQIMKRHGGSIASIPNQPLRPKPCGTKRQEISGATYVPEEGKNEVCADAEDYAGHKASTCRTFHTGDAWQGMIKVKAIGNIYDEEGELALDFTVSEDGSVNGNAHFRRTANRPHLWYINHCTFTRKYSSDEFDLPITGRREKDRFTLKMDPTVPKGIMNSSARCPDGSGGGGPIAAPLLGPLAFNLRPITVEAKDGAINHYLHEMNNDIDTDATIEVHRVPEKSPSKGIPVGVLDFDRDMGEVRIRAKAGADDGAAREEFERLDPDEVVADRFFGSGVLRLGNAWSPGSPHSTCHLTVASQDVVPIQATDWRIVRKS